MIYSGEQTFKIPTVKTDLTLASVILDPRIEAKRFGHQPCQAL
jgi:hypothetical protein